MASPSRDGAHCSFIGRSRARAIARWGLTPRQREVLALLVEGRSNLGIAAELGIREATVEVHVSAVLRRAGVGQRAAVVAAALRGG